MPFFLFWIGLNAIYVSLAFYRARGHRVSDETINAVIENNKRLADGESWTFDKDGNIQHHQVLQFRRK